MSFIKRLINSAIKFFAKKKKSRPARKKHKTISRRQFQKKKVVVRKAKVGNGLKPFLASKAKSGSSSKRKNVSKSALSKRNGLKPFPTEPSKRKDVSKRVLPKEEVIGEITHFFSKIQVVVVKVLKGPVKVGDTIRIKGKKTDFTQKINSMQVESIDVKQAKKGQLIGLKVAKEAQVGDKILKIS